MYKRIIPVIILLISILSACNLPLNVDTPVPAVITSATPSLLPTLTPFPTFTVTPTPLPEIRIEQADQILMQGDYYQAEQEYQTGFTQASDNETRAAALVGIGRSNMLSRDFTQASAAFQSVIDVYPQTMAAPEAYFYLGQCAVQTEQYAKAADAFAGYLSIHPGVLDAFVNELRGDALFANNEYSGAVSAYETAVQRTVAGDAIPVQNKLGQAYAAAGDCENAIRVFMEIYGMTSDEYLKAEMNLRAGQCYLALGVPEQAYARFQDSVNNYPLSYDTYSALVALVDAGQPVDDLNRGIVDYTVGQYGLALDAFNRYLDSNPNHDGTVYYYEGLCFQQMGQFEEALVEFQTLIDGYQGDRFWVDAWDEISYTLWAYLDRYDQASQILLDFVSRVPTSSDAPGMLFQAARILERNDNLTGAAEIWERMVNEYPAEDQSLRGLFLAGISYYRVGDMEKAELDFQRITLLSVDAEEQAGAYVWIGKTRQALGDADGARTAWQQAAVLDPTGYYSERAKELLTGDPPLSIYSLINFEYNLDDERVLAEAWLRTTFMLPEEVDLSDLGPLANDQDLQLGDALWNLGIFKQATAEFEIVRQANLQDPANSFRLLTHFLKSGVNKLAILTSRQILDLAGMSDADTLKAPSYFNHIRFGAFYKDIVLDVAENEGLQPLLVFSLIRQESLFESYAGSTAGAVGLMQLIPSTGEDMANELGLTQGYATEDLLRPELNITLGSHYLAKQIKYFGESNVFAALAGFNAGPGNSDIWNGLAGGDVDLFLEIVRFQETRNYLLNISEFFYIYRDLYSSNPQ